MRRGLSFFGKIRKAALWGSFAFTAAVLFVAFTPVANMMARPLLVEPDVRKADIIAVLGGGAYKNGSLGPASRERLIHGIVLYRERYAPSIIFSGGTITSPSRKIVQTVMKDEGRGMDVIEALIMKDTAERLGVPGENTALDERSANTYENIRNLKAYMEAEGLKTCLIVTSATHMKRASLAAGKAGLVFYPAPVPDYSRFRTGFLDRLSLFHEAAWEYAGLVLYRVYGYI